MSSPSKPFIIGIGHRKQTGKNTFGAMLRMELQLACAEASVENDSFARSLKQICHDLFGLCDEQHYESHPEDKKLIDHATGKTHRQIMIDVGMSMRAIRRDVWINAVMLRAAAPAHNYSRKFVIITDMRFESEAEACDYRIRVTRKDMPDSDDEADLGLQFWTRWDATVNNDFGLLSLQSTAKKMAKAILRAQEVRDAK